MKRGSTVNFDGVYVENTASVVGPKEAEGPLGKYFDKQVKDDLLGQKSHELAEIRFHIAAIRYLLNKSGRKEEDVDLCIAGDLLDEITGASLTMREFDVPFLGAYNACATFAESLITAALFISSGKFKRIISSTSSHFSTAERQYRFPLELGNQRTPLAQWTVTAAGAVMLSDIPSKVAVKRATVGKVVDLGVTDGNDMGACMAPAAADTIVRHFSESGLKPDYYDLIATGDLGTAGSELMKVLAEKRGIKLGSNYNDCGAMIFNRVWQDVGQGGSGAACSSSVFSGYIYKKMLLGDFKRVLLVPTGALCSKTSILQGESIPGIAHAVAFEVVK